MRVVGYLRASTLGQVDDGVSMEVQEDAVRAYCAMRGLELIEVVSDPAVSAGKPLETRDGGKRVLALVRSGAVAGVVAFKLDRLFRDCADALTVVRDWDQHGVALHLIDLGGQAVDTSSAMGRFFLTVMAGAAELERNLIRERTKAALGYKRSRGEAVTRAPRGLRIVDKRFVADPPMLVLVHRAKEMRAEGLTFRAIAGKLTEEGFHAERGKKLHHSVIRYIVNNPRYQACAC